MHVKVFCRTRCEYLSKQNHRKTLKHRAYGVIHKKPFGDGIIIIIVLFCFQMIEVMVSNSNIIEKLKRQQHECGRKPESGSENAKRWIIKHDADTVLSECIEYWIVCEIRISKRDRNKRCKGSKQKEVNDETDPK